ncbi:MAG: hypothetical protein K2X49_05660 [Acetobacteraceae bacterium]|nr:hypothetical protein [Acetobacteraceae bacterium]
MPSVVVHLGAHKTATTYLQKRLRSASTHLDEIGVQYIPMERFRRRVTRFMRDTLREPGNEGVLAERMAEFVRPSPRSILLSDENILGTCSQIVKSGRLYPELTERIQLLARHVPADGKFVLAIRNYPDFLASVYCEALLWMPFQPFAAFLKRFALDDGLWVRVVNDIVKAVGQERLRVFPFEAMPNRFPDLLSELLNRPFDIARIPDSDEKRAGFTGQAVAALAEIAEALDPSATPRLAPLAARWFPRTAQTPRFDPWSPDEAGRLGKLYQDHLVELETAYPGITI